MGLGLEIRSPCKGFDDRDYFTHAEYENHILIFVSNRPCLRVSWSGEAVRLLAHEGTKRFCTEGQFCPSSKNCGVLFLALTV